MEDKDLKKTIDDVEMSHEKTDEIYNNLLMEKRKMERNEKKSRFKDMRKVASIAAAFVIVVSSTVLAYKGINFNFLKFLNKNNIATEKYIGDLDIDEYIYNIDKEVVSEGGKLFINQAIMDKNIIYIYMNFESTNGVKFEDDKMYSFKANVYDEETREITENNTSGSVDDIDLTMVMGNPRVIGVNDNKLDLVFSYDMSKDASGFKGFIGSKVKFDFKDLGYYEKYETKADDGEVISIITSDFKPIIEGNWKTEFKLGGKLLPTKKYKLNEEVKYTSENKDANLVFEKVEISNLSLKLNIKNTATKDVDIIIDLILEKDNSKTGDIQLKTKDGTIIGTKFVEMLTYSETEGLIIDRQFSEPINIEALQSIIVWGEEIKLR